MLFLVLLHYVATLVAGYPTEVSVNPCGIPYPRERYGSARTWEYQASKTLRERISTLIRLINVSSKKDFKGFALEPQSWIPDDSTFSNILDVSEALPKINRGLKFFSCALDILGPHYDGKADHGCSKLVDNFELIYRNHTMLVCESDEAMRVLGGQPVDYPTLKVDIPENWAKINSTDCTQNSLLSYAFFKKYRQYLLKLQTWLPAVIAP